MSTLNYSLHSGKLAHDWMWLISWCSVWLWWIFCCVKYIIILDIYCEIKLKITLLPYVAIKFVNCLYTSVVNTYIFVIFVHFLSPSLIQRQNFILSLFWLELWLCIIIIMRTHPRKSLQCIARNPYQPSACSWVVFFLSRYVGASYRWHQKWFDPWRDSSGLQI
jgi:amino acid permease